mmetsp:Transcript_8570/g.21562  ORF Transcript_8570/g.21562 Transcript_8570/m.21562 type:complete len:335 (+) Transcript_8570:2938-3942(+)
MSVEHHLRRGGHQQPGPSHGDGAGSALQSGEELVVEDAPGVAAVLGDHQHLEHHGTVAHRRWDLVPHRRPRLSEAHLVQPNIRGVHGVHEVEHHGPGRRVGGDRGGVGVALVEVGVAALVLALEPFVEVVGLAVVIVAHDAEGPGGRVGVGGEGRAGDGYGEGVGVGLAQDRSRGVGLPHVRGRGYHQPLRHLMPGTVFIAGPRTVADLVNLARLRGPDLQPAEGCLLRCGGRWSRGAVHVHGLVAGPDLGTFLAGGHLAPGRRATDALDLNRDGIRACSFSIDNLDPLARRLVRSARVAVGQGNTMHGEVEVLAGRHGGDTVGGHPGGLGGES